MFHLLMISRALVVVVPDNHLVFSGVLFILHIDSTRLLILRISAQNMDVLLIWTLKPVANLYSFVGFR